MLASLMRILMRIAAAELRIGTAGAVTNNFDSSSFGFAPGIPITATVDPNAFFSGLLRGTAPINDTFGVYGLIGVTHATFDTKASILSIINVSKSDSDTSFSYGGGIEGAVANNLTLGAEYVRYIDKSSGSSHDTMDGVTATARFKF